MGQKKTFIVMGVSRGGTSLVAGCLSLMGVNIGDNVDEFSHEDRDFHGKSVEAIRGLIELKSTQRDVWGWKYPHTHDFYFKIADTIVNPHLIFVFRDILAVANAFKRHHDLALEKGMREAWHRYGKTIAVAEKADCPKLYLSYEKCLREQNAYLDALAEFCDISLDDKTRGALMEFITPGQYTRLKHVGAD
ncbi:MAG: hypothetical protein AAGI34_00205 [Pseudomonadota bacterium]